MDCRARAVGVTQSACFVICVLYAHADLAAFGPESYFVNIASSMLDDKGGGFLRSEGRNLPSGGWVWPLCLNGLRSVWCLHQLLGELRVPSGE